MEFTAAEVWSRILERARPLLPDQTYRTWLEKTEPLALSEGRLAVGASSEFAAEWIEDKYGKLLHEVAERVLGHRIDISFQHHLRGEDGVRPAVAEVVERLGEPAPASSASASCPATPPPPFRSDGSCPFPVGR